MKISEFQIQAAFFDEIRMLQNSEPRLRWIHGSLNGIRLPIGLAVKAKQAGLIKGLWDVCLPIPSADKYFRTLWIEFKVKGNKLTKEQQEFKDDLFQYYHGFFVCYSAQEGINAVKNYLNIK